MAMGIKTGGRSTGTPNKRTQILSERLEALKCDPVEGLVHIAKAAEINGDIVLAAKCYSDLMPYIYPRRKSTELTGTESRLSHLDPDETIGPVLERLSPGCREELRIAIGIISKGRERE